MNCFASTDGVIMYVKSKWSTTCNIDKINNFKFIGTDTKINYNAHIQISALYTCHDYSITEFIDTLNLFLTNNKKTRIIAEFTINIGQTSDYTQQFLSTFLEHEYLHIFMELPNLQKIIQILAFVLITSLLKVICLTLTQN